jgi:mono/diheme cytochrome c family protein
VDRSASSHRLSSHRFVAVAGAVAFVLLSTGGAWATPASADLPQQVTWSEHVAPILFQRCVACHRPNDVAPMSLLTYKEARPWAKSIRQTVTTRQMPPWDADPRYGKFSNDISLTDEQVAVVARWVDQGAPEGDPTKVPAPPPLPEPGTWKMGRQPDYVVELAPVDVPADGPDLFITQVYGMNVPDGKWVQAIELLPGNTSVLHHVVTYLGPFGMDGEQVASEVSDGVERTIFLNDAAKRPAGMAERPSLGGVWVAGSPPSVFPPGTGQPLVSKQLVSLNMHYHPSGAAATDGSKLGFYFGEGELQKVITTAFAADPGMIIPPQAEDHAEHAIYLFAQDSKILSFLPHMHVRGKSMEYTLELPDGRKEVLLSVPEYDYNWQNIYRLEEPVPAPAGSILHVEARWNNSESNIANPDPGREISWGEGTNDEMLVAFFDFIVDEGQKPKAVRGEEYIGTLLARHDPEDAYAIRLEGMAFGGPWGLVVPEQGEGMFYLAFGPLMFSSTVPETFRLEDEVVLNASMVTGGGGTRLPIAFLARYGENGTLTGEAFFNQRLDPKNLDAVRGKGQAFSGTSLAAAKSAQASTPSAGS